MDKVKKLHNTGRYPTTLLVRGADPLGVEIAKSLLEQGGYVIIVDHESEYSEHVLEELKSYKLFTLLDLSAITNLDDELRRLDYVFYFQHKAADFSDQISTQEFLQFSNYLDTILDLTAKFEAKLLLTTAVKAHQLIISSKQIDINYFPGAEDTHNVYTEFEAQRYAESLVKEYEQKVGVDARIIRIGEIIGKGIEANLRSNLVKLVLEGLEGEYLTIPGDGLDSDYYVHNLDAAYGILKAQFSLNTKGKIFTLSNEEDVSVLSIGYKLLDLMPEVKDIKFKEGDHSLPPLKLYKPAANLTEIGWKPRVNFERALSQTIDYIKFLLANNAQVIPDPSELENVQEDEDRLIAKKTSKEQKAKSKKTVKDKLRDFFFIAEEEQIAEEKEEQLDGALARLVAERKSQEKARKGSIIMANTKMRNKLKPEKQLTSLQKLTENLNNVLISLKKRFIFLKNVTLVDFVVGSIGLAAFLVIYFMLLSPVLSLGKNVFFIKANISGLKESMKVYNFEDSKKFNTDLKNHLSEAQDRMEELEFIFDITGNEQLYIDTQNLLGNSVQYFSGYEEVFIALEPLGKYIGELDPQVTHGFSSSSVLAIGNNQEFPQQLSEMKVNSRLISVGLTKIKKSEQELLTNMEKMPDFIKNQFGTGLNSVIDNTGTYDFLEQTYPYIPTLLGDTGRKNFLIVIQDNSRYTAGGGEITGFVLMEFDKGGLVNIDVSTADTLARADIGFKVDDQVLSEISLVSNKDVTRSNITFSDLSLVADKDVLLGNIESIYSLENNKNIDLTFSMNLRVIEAFLEHRGEVQYQQVNFDHNNLLANTNLLIGDNVTQTQRNEVILNLASIVLSREFNSISTNLSDTLYVITESVDNSDIKFYSSNRDIKNLILSLGDNFNVEDTISFGLNYDQETVITDKYPIGTIVIEVLVNKDFSTKKSIELKADGISNFQNSFVCTPNGSQDITYAEVEANLVTTTFSSDKVCSIFLEDEDLKYITKYNTIAFDNSRDSGYNYILELEKTSGIFANYEVRFSFADGLTAIPENKDFSQQGDTFVYNKAGFEEKGIFKFNIN